MHLDEGHEGRIVVVCTANMIRSPFIAELLRTRIGAMEGRRLRIDSAGVAALEGRQADERVRDLGGVYGLDLERHRAAFLDDAVLRGAPTVLCAERVHRKAVLDRRPDLVSSVFTVREFARLVRVDPPRRTGAPGDWSTFVHHAATARFADRHVADTDDDIVDPVAGDAALWSQFENQAVAAVSSILAAVATLPPVAVNARLVPLASRREYRRSLARRS